MTITCGEATIRLLARYGISHVFGIPGVHTLDMCRGLTGGDNAGAVQHIQARTEAGAGFMAEGWARATGEVGVALVISGPGVTNSATALAQCYADSLPMLLISAEPPSDTLGKGWGVLHEITEQKKVTEPITAFSATAMRPSDIPDMMARAFSIFSSSRPRPCHISIPIDVQAMPVDEIWEPVSLPGRPTCPQQEIAAAATLLTSAKAPLIMVGGGAVGAASEIRDITEMLGAITVSSTAGKGIVPDDHPLSLSAAMIKAEGHAVISAADVILAVGTELSETDSFAGPLKIHGDLIRVDIDPRKISDLFPARLGIVSDAAPAMAMLKEALKGHKETISQTHIANIREVRNAIDATLNPTEKQHNKVLQLMRDHASDETIFSCDSCQIAYTGSFTMPMRKPQKWFFPAGYCSLGNALPNAIGAKMAKPETPVAVVVGDGGFMFTMPELITAAEHHLALPVVIWENGGLKQIQDDMDIRAITRVGVEGINPDFELLAKACHCYAERPEDADAFIASFSAAFNADRPTLIIIREGDDWLK